MIQNPQRRHDDHVCRAKKKNDGGESETGERENVEHQIEIRFVVGQPEKRRYETDRVPVDAVVMALDAIQKRVGRKETVCAEELLVLVPGDEKGDDWKELGNCMNGFGTNTNKK